ncbi:MAG: NAD(P)-binding protein [Verrucomicrobia bacterium]|jgi:phytoene dehydrogenase-like protein|nr:NAD(P)-binding protein [Verrucomicrobiota bacterium]
MKHPNNSVLIVGAGMAGLACALKLHEAGRPVQLFEGGDKVGGRVRTDRVDGFLLDRGFQVYLDTYPETGKLLDVEALDLRPFAPGALVYRDGRLHRLMDVFRRPASLWPSLIAPVGSFADKLRVGRLRAKILGSSSQRIAERPDRSTETYLRESGFSEPMIDDFFRAFYGGIFLERDLQTSSRMFEFTFKLFGRGSATVPARGMGEIPAQLASRLPQESIHLNCPVRKIDRGQSSLTLADGRSIKGSAIVIATDGSTAHRLLADRGPAPNAPKWRSVTNLYFSAEQSPVREAIICLNGSGQGRVNNVCVMSDAAPAYAPVRQSLISVSVLGLHDDTALSQEVLDELADWFGPVTKRWKHLRTDRIEQGLPEQLAGRDTTGLAEYDGVWVCGDHLSSASIEGAVVSGQKAAEAVCASLGAARKSGWA